jgi:hypothetical protein
VDGVSRFISRLGEKALPLYRLLKKIDTFVWTDEADAVLAELKRVLSTAPILAAPGISEPMLLYIAASNWVVSVVLVVERDEEGQAYAMQRLTYYLNEVTTESKQRYPYYQKLAYGVFFTARKLRHYFSEHTITVVSDAPLYSNYGNCDATGRVAEWSTELTAFEIHSEPHKTIKS